MCLFNAEILRAKLADAKMVLDSDDSEQNEDEAPLTAKPLVQSAPVTPQAKKTSVPRVEDSPHTPELSSKGPSAASSPLPGTPGGATLTHTIASLAKLPASEILRIVSSPSSATGLPIPKADSIIMQGTDEFIDTLRDHPPHVQKQRLGDKL